MIALSDLDPHGLTDEVRRREADYRAGLAELDRRAMLNGRPWSEERTAAWLERRRTEPNWQENWRAAAAENSKVEDLPPPLFRMGYEWAILSVMSILESVLDRPSADIVELWDFTPAGRDLYRKSKQTHVYDARRRGAFELIGLLTGFVNTRLSALYTVYPLKTTRDFMPSDNDLPPDNQQQTKQEEPGAA